MRAASSRLAFPSGLDAIKERNQDYLIGHMSTDDKPDDDAKCQTQPDTYQQCPSAYPTDVSGGDFCLIHVFSIDAETLAGHGKQAIGNGYHWLNTHPPTRCGGFLRLAERHPRDKDVRNPGALSLAQSLPQLSPHPSPTIYRLTRSDEIWFAQRVSPARSPPRGVPLLPRASSEVEKQKATRR